MTTPAPLTGTDVSALTERAREVLGVGRLTIKALTS